MPVIKAENWEKEKPEWCRFSAYGLYKLRKGEKEADYHFHDCDEYVIIAEGKALLVMEGKECRATAWDCACVPMGGMHYIPEVEEDLALIWIYDELKGEKRKGHIPEGSPGRKDPLPVKTVRLGQWWEEKPAWSRLADCGILDYPGGKIEMDYHYHDCHEYYFVTRGRLTVLVNNEKMEAGEGEIVCIEKGKDHVPLEAQGVTQFIWLQDELIGEKRRGHLHH